MKETATSKGAGGISVLTDCDQLSENNSQQLTNVQIKHINC